MIIATLEYDVNIFLKHTLAIQMLLEPNEVNIKNIALEVKKEKN